MIKKRKIIFRADASDIIGMGHVIRSLSLAQMLNEDFECVFATRLLIPSLEEQIIEICKSIVKLPINDDHFDAFISLLKGDEIIVLDNYFFDTEYQRKIKCKGCKLVCIDDIADKHFVADIVINHSLAAYTLNYSIENYSKTLFGSEYTLLRKEFFERSSSRDKFKGEELEVFLSFGGADPLGYSKGFAQSLDCLPNVKKIHLVLGAANFSNHLYSGTKLHLYNGLSSREMIDVMQKCNLAIVPASTIAMELCKLYIPFIVGYYIDNQESIYKGFIDNKLAIGVGDFRGFDTSRIGAVLNSLTSDKLDRIIINQRGLFDDNIPQRFINEFKEL